MTSTLDELLPEGWATALAQYGYRSPADFVSTVQLEGGAESLATLLGCEVEEIERLAGSLATSLTTPLEPVDHPLGCLFEDEDEAEEVDDAT